MESTCSERFLSDETEYYLYPKRIKIESNQKSIEEEEQQKLEHIQGINTYQTLQHDPVHLAERKTSWSLEKQSCGASRKTFVREILHLQTCRNQGLPCRLSEKLSAKKWSPENKDQNTKENGTSLNAHCQPLETESLSKCSAAGTSENVQILSLPQVQQNNTENNKGDNGLKQNSSVAPLNRDLFQMKLHHKFVSDKKWKQELSQIPSLCGTSSMFSHVEDEKSNSLKKVYSTEEKVYSITDTETSTERGNKEKKNPSYVVPTLKPFKSIQRLEIPNFLLSSISNKINSKMSSTNLKEMNWKNFKGPSSLMQSQQIYDMQKISEIGRQKLLNAKSSVTASTVDSEFKGKNDTSISKQEHSALAEGGRASVTYFKGKIPDIKCNANCFKEKMLENSADDDGNKSRSRVCISAKKVQNEKYVSCNDLLKRMRRKSCNENAGIFHIQRSIPLVIESLEKNKLATHCGTHNSNSDISLCEVESKLSTKEIIDFKKKQTETIAFENKCPHSIVQKFLSKKVICNTARRKGMAKVKFSFQDMLFGRGMRWPESLYRDAPTCQDDSIRHWSKFCETSNEQCDAQELVNSNIDRKSNNNFFLLAVISRNLNVEVLKTTLSSFFNSTNTFLPTEGKFMRVVKHSLCDRKQDQLNPCAENTLRQNTEFYKKIETYPVLVHLKFMESIGFELHKECQRRYLGEEEPTFLKIATLFHNQNPGLPKGKCSRRYHLLSRGNGGFSTYMRSASHKSSTEKQILVAKCLILLQGDFDYSSLDKTYCFNVTKIQYLLGANFRFWNCFHAHSQLKAKKVNSKCTNQEILVATVKQKKASRMFKSFSGGERFKSFPFVLCENNKHETIGCRNYIRSKNEDRNEVTYTMKKYLGTSSNMNDDRKEYVKSNKLEINSQTFFSKKSFSIFDTYEKIPLTTDSEDFDQIPVNQDNSVQKKLSEENAVTSSKEVHNLPIKTNGVLNLPDQSKTTVEKCCSLLLQDSQTNQPEYCKNQDTYSEYFASKKVEDQNPFLYFENVFPSSSNVSHCVTLPLDSSFVNAEKGISEDGHCRSSSSAKKQKQSEKKHATVQYPFTGSPAVTDTCLQSQPKETGQLSLEGNTQANKEVNLEPATLKQHLEYVENQEDINYERIRIINESQCENVMNVLIMPYSEDVSKTLIAPEEKLKMHLRVINNGSLEDVKDKYLPLENKITYEFELKRKFALVLEELHMFHEISKGNENNLSSLETNSLNYCELNSEGIDENVTSVSQEKICISSPICGTTEEQNITCSNESILNKKTSNENEDHEVSKEYCISKLSSEELLHSPTAGGYYDATYEKPYMWNPAFLSCTLRGKNYHLQEEGGSFLSRDVIRVQPLKTCKGPIRVGLSRKARPKQLHPYLK